MAGDAVTPAPAATDPAGEIAGYLADLDRRLRGPRRKRADIVAEIGDGLLAAADRHRDRGATPLAAARAALTQLGPPEAVVRAFAGELATARARHLLAALLLTGPLVGVWWLLLLTPAWPTHPTQLWAAIPVLPLVGAAVVAAGAVLTTTGGHARRLPRLSPRRAQLSVQVVVAACAATDVTMLVVLGAVTIAGATGHPPVLVVAAAAASLARLLWLGRSARGCRRSALSLH
jgi:hypothetical protein